MTAFAHLNLRRNPFGELTHREWTRVAVCDVDAVTAALARPRTAVQIVAPCGRGKTTHLLAIGARVGRYARPDTDGVPDDGPWDVLLLDEADRLWPWTRWRLLRRARSAAIAVHSDRSWELAALGFRVITVRPSVDAPRLAALVERRIEAARRAPGAVPRVPMATVSALLARHGDDVRAVVGDLYEHFQRLPGVIDVVV